MESVETHGEEHSAFTGLVVFAKHQITLQP
jgi:hypothetical protein